MQNKMKHGHGNRHGTGLHKEEAIVTNTMVLGSLEIVVSHASGIPQYDPAIHSGHCTSMVLELFGSGV